MTKTKLNITPGGWYYTEHNWKETSIYAKHEEGCKYLGTLKIDSSVTEDNQEELELIVEANAKLIAEAGTVTNESGYTPRELLEQRDEAMKVIEKVVRLKDLYIPSPNVEISDYHIDEVRALNNMLNECESLINKLTN